MAILHYRDPGTGNWVELGTTGIQGPAGPDEVLIQPAAPTPVAGLDLWIDSDDAGPLAEAASVAYVDAADALLATNIGGKVSKTGDTISGDVILNGKLTVNAKNVTVTGPATEQHGTAGAAALTAFNVVATSVNIRGADPIHVGAASNNAAVRIENVATPVANTDVANKAYADSKIVAAAVRPTNVVGVTAPMIWIPTT